MKQFLGLLVLVLLLSSCGGRNTSNTNQSKEESPYGDWEVRDYVNDFDEPTGKKYVRQIIKGDFSNSATASSPLRVYVYLYEGYSGVNSVQGKMLFDEYCDGVEDFHIWGDASPAQQGTKIIDKANHKAYYYKYRSSFRDIDDDKKWYDWIDIFRNTPSTYTVTIKGEYQDEYRFSINTDKLNIALKDAGIIVDDNMEVEKDDAIRE